MWWFNYQSHTWLLRGWGANQVPVFRQYGAMGYICLGWKLRSRTLQTEFWASRCGRIRLFSNKCGPNFHELFGLFDSQLFLYSEAQNIILCSNQFTILCFKIKSQSYMKYFSCRIISKRRLYSTEEIHELVLIPFLAFCHYNLQRRKQGTTTLRTGHKSGGKWDSNDSRSGEQKLFSHAALPLGWDGAPFTDLVQRHRGS